MQGEAFGSPQLGLAAERLQVAGLKAAQSFVQERGAHPFWAAAWEGCVCWGGAGMCPGSWKAALPARAAPWGAQACSAEWVPACFWYSRQLGSGLDNSRGFLLGCLLPLRLRRSRRWWLAVCTPSVCVREAGAAASCHHRAWKMSLRPGQCSAWGAQGQGFGYWCVGGIVFSRCCHCWRLNSKRSS